ncbi:MAG: oligosaccharide flippase family protein, partial [Aestuariibaculum sp.]
MKRTLGHIHKLDKRKDTSLYTVLIAVKIIVGIIITKVLSVVVGPLGLALVGNFQDFVTAFQNISIMGFYKGVSNVVSHVKDSILELSKVVSTVYYIGFFVTFLVSFFCYFNAESINKLIFPRYNSYAYVVRVFALVLPFYAVNMFSFAIMWGFSKRNSFMVINIIGQVLIVCIALLLIFINRVEGALISVAISESIIFLITLVAIVNRRSMVPLVKVENFDFGVLKKLWSFSLIALFAFVFAPLISITIRMYIIETVSYRDAGFWEAIRRVSNGYMAVIGPIVAMWALSGFPEIQSFKKTRKRIIQSYRKIIPILVLILLVVFFTKSLIVKLIFTDEFEPIKNLFKWQLMGDFVKMLSAVIVYQFLAKRMFWYYVVIEAFFIFIWYTTSVYFIDMYHSAQGAVIAHFV